MISCKEVFNYLDEYVIGQNDAKETVANALVLHLARLNYYVTTGNKTKKSNLLLMGPTGCGKTFLIEKAAEYAELPFIKVNAKSLTNTGYVGTTIDNIIYDAYMKCKTPATFPYGIVLIDEFDKIVHNAGDQKSWYTNLQYSLLKMLEGAEVCTFTQGLMRSTGVFTDNMMFILAGNFQYLRKNRETPSKGIGFTQEELHTIQSDDNFHKQLIKYGVVREIVGRTTHVAELKHLTLKELKNILNESKSSILREMLELFKYYGKEIDLSPRVLDTLVKEAYTKSTGARGLQAVIEAYFTKELTTLKLPGKPKDLILKTQIKALSTFKDVKTTFTIKKDNKDD